jgi:hypothetical protein
MTESSSQLPRHESEGIRTIAQLAHIYIWTVSVLIIGSVFATVTLKDIPFYEAIARTNPEYFQAIILSVYISCWSVGCTFDVFIQSSVYSVDPLGGALRKGSIFAVGALALAAIIILQVRDNELRFACALTAFVLIDFGAWLYLRYFFLKDIIDASQTKYQRDIFGLIQFNLVVKHITGVWHFYRLPFMLAILFAMITMALQINLNQNIAELINKRFSSIDRKAVQMILPDLMLLCFVAVSELWNFGLRLRTFFYVRFVRTIERDYKDHIDRLRELD